MQDREKAPEYRAQEIEAKWQRRWDESGLYKMVEDPSRPKHYALTMLPYTSGDLHIGHWYAMSPSDSKARYMRMKGYNVFFPMGFDAFGLPAENAAIKHGIHPREWTFKNIEHMRHQLCSMGASFAWDNEAVTCLPGFYKWTEWFFLKMYEMGLAYRKKSPVDFCPTCNTTLAREQVWGDDRHCERCGTPVIKKDLEQWFFRITDYADQLLEGLDRIDWPERIKTMQRNWIGRSEGAQVTFKSEQGDDIVVFTTRPDTLWGATFMVLAPEHPLVDKLAADECMADIEGYRNQAARQSEIERLATDKEKTGLFIGAYAVNPVNGKRIPIWIADYVMLTYGTGAIMAVPAHDERDFAFAVKFGLPIVPVIGRLDHISKSMVPQPAADDGLEAAFTEAGIRFELVDGAYCITLKSPEQVSAYVATVQAHLKSGAWVDVVGAQWLTVFADEIIVFDSVETQSRILARIKALCDCPEVQEARTYMEFLDSVEWYQDVLFHAEYGEMIHSAEFSGTPGDVAKGQVISWLSEKGIGCAEVNYRLRDWLISRQRYWGAPIPMVYCDECGIVPVPFEDLPVLLPDDAEFMPTGESPLKYHKAFYETTCPKCGGPAKRETDTMDTFMCSSWYQYAYVSPYYEGETPIDPAKGAYWLPVDQYTGGVEHATMHLMYTRFFTKVMHDMGLVDFDEPMLRLFTQGIILGEDNEKMSKSRGNVVNPDDYVSTVGADAVRAFIMFIGPWELGGSWVSTGIDGITRFMNRVWSVVLEPRDEPQKPATAKEIADLRRLTHKTIHRVTDDIEVFKFNTMLAALMEFNNYLLKAKDTDVYGTEAWAEAVESMVLMCAPIMPHITEELWELMGKPYSVHQQSWPAWSEELAADDVVTIVIQVNGKVRARLQVPADITDEDANTLALAQENVQRYIEGKKIVKQVYVPGRLVNIVVRG